MPINFDQIMNDLYASGLIIAGLVSRKNGQVQYMSSNWSVEQTDISKCINGWSSRSQFVMLQGVKYSMLLCQPEYFSAINYKEKSWLVGAQSPEENGDRYYVIAYAPPGADGKNAYVEVARAANRMKEGGSYLDPNAQLGKAVEGGAAAPAAPAGAAIDPALKQEIDGFITWLKDPNGLSGYISYYLAQNDANVIAKLAKAYNDFRQVFGF